MSRLGWTTPKTNWVISDYFNIDDFNRMVENIEFIHMLAEPLFGTINIEEMPEYKQVSSYFYPEDFNVIIRNLNLLNTKTYNLQVTLPSEYSYDSYIPGAYEFNTVETLTSDLYELLVNATLYGRRRLAFNLGGGDF